MDEWSSLLIEAEKQTIDNRDKQKEPKLGPNEEDTNAMIPDDDEEEYTIIDDDPEFEHKIHENAFYGLAGDVVRLIEPRSEADPVAVLVNFLLCFGNMIGKTAYFEPDTRHHAKLYVTIIGNTATGAKGTAGVHVDIIMKKVDPIFETRVTKGIASGEGIVYTVRDKRMAKREVKVKGKPTGEYEEYIADHGVDDKRRIISLPEFGKFLRVLQRDGNTAGQFMREMWDGNGNVEIPTRNDPIKATNTHVSIWGNITPRELLHLSNETEMFDGTHNRIIWIYSKMSKLLPRGGKFHEINIDSIVKRIQDAALFAMKEDFPRMEWGEEAGAIWDAEYAEFKKERPGKVGGILARGAPNVMRLAMIYALLDKTNIVRVEHLNAAKAIWEYSVKTVKHIYGDAKLKFDPNVLRLLSALESRLEGMTFSQITKEVFNGHIKREDRDALISDMLKDGLIRSRFEKTARRPKQIIELVRDV